MIDTWGFWSKFPFFFTLNRPEHSDLSKQFTYLLTALYIFTFLFSVTIYLLFVKFLLIENNRIFIDTSFQKSIPPSHICNIQLYSSKIQIGFFSLCLIKFLWLVSDPVGLQTLQDKFLIKLIHKNKVYNRSKIICRAVIGKINCRAVISKIICRTVISKIICWA